MNTQFDFYVRNNICGSMKEFCEKGSRLLMSKEMKRKPDYFDIEKAYYHICRAKGVTVTESGLEKYTSAMTTLYHAVCLDIDDTITYKNQEERKLIVDALAQLTKRNVIICFITGRGRSSAFDFLNDLKDFILKSDSHIHPSQFKRWYCVTNNGYMLYSNDYVNETGFLTLSKVLVPSEVRLNYYSIKPLLQKKIATLLSERLSVPYDVIIKDSALSIGENSLRFPISPKHEKKINNSLLNEIQSIVSHSTPHFLGVSRGVYHKTGKIVIEVSMTTKGAAIDTFEADLGIPQNKMVRIGDQGDEAGNDFEMLNNICGFSVGKLSTNPTTCWPVMHFCDPYVDPDILSGVTATACLLKMLKLYPAICLEKPEEKSYRPRLAMSEKRNIAANKATYNYYENQLKYAFRYDTDSFSGVWNYIDEKTGAFYIHDSEYELLRVINPNHILFKIYDCKLESSSSYQPRLRFALRTDTGLLLRGPMNYYYGLSFRKTTRENISKNFIKRLNQNRVHFFKICIASLSNSNDIDVKDSITRRVLLGIMDSIRDYLILNINIQLQAQVGNNDTLYFYSTLKESEYNATNTHDISKLYYIAKENLIYMYNCLFDNIDAKFTNHFYLFLKDTIMPFTLEIERFIDKINDNYDFKKGCRVWREIDSFYENVVAVDTSINKLLYDCDTEGREVLFTGIRYGSIELPIIVSMLLDVKYEYFKINFSAGCMCLNSNYEENHSNVLRPHKRGLRVINREEFDSDNYFHVLMDDNLVTGRTLQLAMNLLADNGLYPDRLIVVRYPSLNRIKHMFLPNHGAPDVDLFWEYVYGLTSPTPYTKLNHPACYEKNSNNKYLDALGQFNKTRTYVVELLFKNGLYSIDGEVNERGE